MRLQVKNAAFRDYLIVLEKGGSQDKCAFIYLKRKLRDIDAIDSANIPMSASRLSPGKQFEDDSIFVTWKNQDDIVANWRDLGKFVIFNTVEGERLTDLFDSFIERSKEKITTLANSKLQIQVLRGLEPLTENLLNAIFIVRAIDKRRASHSDLLLTSEDEYNATGIIRSTKMSFTVPKKALKKGAKTASYLPKLDIGDVSDLVIMKDFDGFKTIKDALDTEVDLKNIKQQSRDRFSHLLFSRRFDFTSPGTKLLSFFSSEEILAGKAFWVLSFDEVKSKSVCVWLNSSIVFIEALMSLTETRGSFIEITKEKLLDFHIPDFTKCDTTYLENAFEKIRNTEFPPLIEQFENPPDARKIIDRAVLRTIGYSEDEIINILPQLYKSLAIELRSWKELMHQTTSKEKEPVSQLHLFSKE